MEGAEALIASIDSTNLIRLDGSAPPLAQIAAALQGRDDVASLDILTHGAPGVMLFSGGAVNASALMRSQADLAQIRATLGEDAHVRLFACNLAQGPQGTHFVDTLADQLNVKLAASTDLTGAAELGGDWELEWRSHADIAQSEHHMHFAAYEGLLQTIVTFDDVAITSNGQDLGSSVIESGGYRFAYSAGNWFGTTTDGTGSSKALVAQQSSGPAETITVTRIDNAAFDFQSFDYLNYVGFATDLAQVQGFLSGSSVATISTGLGGTGTKTMSGDFDTVDRVVITADPATGFFATVDTFVFGTAGPVDSTAPKIVSVVRQSPAANPTNADSITFRITFDEDVQNVDSDDFDATGTTGDVQAGGVNTINANIYDVTVSGGDMASYTGEVGLEIASSQNIEDLAGNPLVNTTPTGVNETYMLDNTPPNTPSTPDLAAGSDTGASTTDNVTNVTTLTFTGTGDANVTVTLTSSFDGVVGSTTSDGAGDWTVIVSTLTPGSHTMTASASDALGNTSAASPGLNIEIDITAPVLASFARQNPTTQITNADSLTFAITFDSIVVNVTADDFAISGTTAAGVIAGSGSSYSLIVSGGNLADLNGVVGLDLAAGQDITDVAGNVLASGEPPTDETYTVQNDLDAPTVTLSSLPGPVNGPFTVNITFSEAVTGLVAGAFQVGNGNASNLQGSGQAYTIDIVPAASGQVTIDLGSGAATDGAGNGNVAAPQLSIIADLDAPTVAAFKRFNPTAETTDANQLVFSVTFSEPVLNVDATDFTATGVSGVTLSVTGAGAAWQVTISGGGLNNFNGVVGLDLAAGQDIADVAGNFLASGEPPTDETYTVQNDLGAPQVVSIHVQPGTGPNAEQAVFLITFDENANNVAMDHFALTSGNTATGTISAVSAGSGTQITVTVNAIAGTGTLRLDLKAANNIVDDLGNGPAPAFTNGAILPVDRDAPGVEISGAPESITGPELFEVMITFTEPVVGFGVDGISLINASVSALSGNGADYVAIIAPTGGGDVTIAIKEGATTDLAGNPNQAAEPVTVRNDLAARTREQIATFMVQRAHGIIAGQPDLDGFLNANPGPAVGPLGMLAGEANDTSYDLSFFTSRGMITQGLQAPLANRYAPFGSDSVAGSTPRFDTWIRLAGSNSYTSQGDGALWLAHTGAHYRVNEDLLIGVMGQFDYATLDSSDELGKVEGWGWMAGPYLVARAPGQSLSFDGRVLFGQSNNQISPLGTFEDDFNTTRWLLRGRISGDYLWGALTVTPAVSVSWFQETQHDYTDTLGNSIDDQAIELGEVAFGPAFSYDWLLASGMRVRPWFSIDGVWTFAANYGAANAKGAGFESDTLRARGKAGFDVTVPAGWSIKADGYAEGLGAGGEGAYGGSVSIAVPF